MENTSGKYTGILLAGGMSRRMGSDKGSLKLGGRMLYRYALSALEKVCPEILISSSMDLPGTENYIRVADAWEKCGPLGGIHACLKHSSTEKNLVLAYDMPLVNSGLLGYLLDHSGDCMLVAPVPEGGKPEPLCAIYSKKLLPFIEEQLEKKELAVHRLFPKVNAKLVHVGPGMPFFQDNLFLNVNNPYDLDLLNQNSKRED